MPPCKNMIACRSSLQSEHLFNSSLKSCLCERQGFYCVQRRPRAG